MERLATELFAQRNVACAVVAAASARLEDRWERSVGAAGQLALGDPRRVTPSTWFDLASLTKPVTALAAARLARRGALALSVPLGTYLPELAGTPAAEAPLELLLAHRAGLDAHRTLFRHLLSGVHRGALPMLFEAASARRADAVGVVPEAGFPPVYSDLGYLLVGEALARVTGEPLDVTLEREVLSPLRLAIGSARRLSAKDANFTRDVAATEVVAWRGGVVRGLVHDENAWAFAGEGAAGHAGLFGTAAAVVGLGEMLVDVHYGRADWFLTRDELAPLIKPRPLGTLRAGFDGKSAQGSSSGSLFGPSSIGHLGFTGTSLWCDLDRQVVGVLLTNRVHPTRENDEIRRARPSAYDRIAEWARARLAASSAPARTR